MTKLKYANIRPLRVEFISGGSVPRVQITYEGVTELWTYGPVSQLDDTDEWTFTQEANGHGKVEPVHGVAKPVSRQAGHSGAGGNEASGLQPGQTPEAPGAGAGADSLAAIFERLLTFANMSAYSKFALNPRDPRVKAARQWAGIPGGDNLPPLPYSPAATPIGACPCLRCTLDRAFTVAHGHDFAAELEALGAAALFIELGGKSGK